MGFLAHGLKFRHLHHIFERTLMSATKKKIAKVPRKTRVPNPRWERMATQRWKAIVAEINAAVKYDVSLTRRRIAREAEISLPALSELLGGYKNFTLETIMRLEYATGRVLSVVKSQQGQTQNKSNEKDVPSAPQG